MSIAHQCIAMPRVILEVVLPCNFVLLLGPEREVRVGASNIVCHWYSRCKNIRVSGVLSDRFSSQVQELISLS